MADKLSERLGAAVERLYEDGMDTRGIADLFREAAELARRVEGGTLVEWNYRAGVVRPDWYGQRVRLVPEPPEVG